MAAFSTKSISLGTNRTRAAVDATPVRSFSLALAHQLTAWLASLLIQVKTQMPRLPLARQC
jgi:hypothetical protein